MESLVLAVRGFLRLHHRRDEMILDVNVMVVKVA